MTSQLLPSPTGPLFVPPFRGLNAVSEPLSRVMDPNRNGARTHRRATETPTFVGVDGEGITTLDGQHLYVLLGVGDKQVCNPQGLSFSEIMSFLYKCYEEQPHAVYVGFYLGYDFANWLKGIPIDRATSLLLPDGIEKRTRKSSGGNTTPFPVRYGRWEFDLLPGSRRFRLRPICCGTPWSCSHKSSRWMYICDAGPFFQCSLLKAIDPKGWGDEPIVTEAEFTTLVQGKEARGSAGLDDDMRRYNRLENEVFGRLMGRQASGLMGMGVRLQKDQWFGPGQVSAAWLSKQGIPRRARHRLVGQTHIDAIQEIARQAYYGGWFEIFMHGKVRGASYAYDINSAYPHVMSTLPCLLHGRWSHGRGQPNGLLRNEYLLCKATVAGDDPYIGAVLHRTAKGGICRPTRSSGVYWWSELDAAVHAGVISSINVEEWWHYEPCDCPPPLAALSDLYRLRQEVGKDTSLGKAAKLVYNSAYGKFAQSVGAAPFGNWIYASLTTAGCRRIILDAIANHPYGTSDVEMVATDGIFFRTRHPTLCISEKLGDWSESIKDDLCLYKPGFYWDRVSVGQANFRSRGIRAGDFTEQIPRVEAQFDAMHAMAREAEGKPIVCDWPSVVFTSRFAIVSPLLALRRGKWETAGKVETNRQILQSSDPQDKRVPYPFSECLPHWNTSILRTLPWEDMGSSLPYTKRYAEEDPWSPENKEEYGLTPDGTTTDMWNEEIEELR